MLVKVRYECAGCGWRWVREWKAPLEVAALFASERTVSVPEFASPCCGEHAAD